MSSNTVSSNTVKDSARAMPPTQSRSIKNIFSTFITYAFYFSTRILPFFISLEKFVPRIVSNSTSRLLHSPHSPGRKDTVFFSLPYSHYCEKIRWALDLCNEPYEEKKVAPNMLRVTSRWNGSQSGKLPLTIATVDGERCVLSESSEVLDMLCKHRGQSWLYPTAETKELEQYFGDKFGRPSFHIAYKFVLAPEMEKSTNKYMMNGVPFWQGFCNLMWPTTRQLMHSAFSNEEFYKSNLAVVDEAFSIVERKLKQNGPFICGKSISAADISFAALAYPLILPPEHEGYFFGRDSPDLPPEYAKIVDKYRSTKAGKFVLWLYANHRYPQ